MSHNGVEVIDSDSTSSSPPTSGSAISIPNSKAARRGATILRFRAMSHRSVRRSPHYLGQGRRERHHSDILILFGGIVIKQTFSHR